VVYCNDRRLPLRYAATISNPEHELFLSVASSWEILIKYQIGKLELPHHPTQYIRKHRKRLGIRSLAIYETAIQELSKLPLHHHDPFDRLIISQTNRYQLTLMTLDHQFEAYDVSILPTK
jgi:PIN domain nuclease of toxin-antitoxin system